jgi:hypothetical protein
VAMVGDVAYGQAAVVGNRDSRGVAEQRCVHCILLFLLCSQSGCKENHTAIRMVSLGWLLFVK